MKKSKVSPRASNPSSTVRARKTPIAAKTVPPARRAKIVSSAIHKGGTGKTTCAVHLAHRLHERGFKTLLVDTDTQGNATMAFVDERIESGGASLLYHRGGRPQVVEDSAGILIVPADLELIDAPKLRGARQNFGPNLRKLASSLGVDYVVIDTPPTLDDGTLLPLAASDFAFSPVVPDAYGAPGVLSLVQRLRLLQEQHNPDLVMLGLLINRLNRRNRFHLDVVEALAADPGTSVIPHWIGERSAIAGAAFLRQPVWTTRNGAAAVAGREMRTALDWIINTMEKAHG